MAVFLGMKFGESFEVLYGFSININILRLPVGSDFEALHCLPSRNPPEADTKLYLTSEPPLLG